MRWGTQGFLVPGESPEREPLLPAIQRLVPRVPQRGKRGGVHVDRHVPACGGRAPRSGQELLGCGDERFGALSHTFGFHQRDVSIGRKSVNHRDHLVHERRRQRFHSLRRNAFGNLREHVLSAGKAAHEIEGALSHLGSQKDLAARGSEEFGGGLHGALICHGECSNLIHLIAKKLEAQRMGLRGWENVNDSAAHSELAAPLHHVNPHVGGTHEIVFELFRINAVPHAHADGCELAKARGDGLKKSTHRHDEDAQRIELLAVGEAALGQKALGNGVRARGQPLVRQGLPRRKELDGRIRKIGAQRTLEFFGTPSRRGDGHDERSGLPRPPLKVC